MLIAEVMTLEMYKAAFERDVSTFKNNCLEPDAPIAAKNTEEAHDAVADFYGARQQCSTRSS